jgi:uncharacterized membrane protein (UPF0182 family)
VTYSPLKSFRIRTFLFWLLVIAALLAFSGSLVHLVTEAWWFASVNLEAVFWTRVKWQLGLGIATFAIYALALGANYRLAQRLTRDRSYQFLTRYTNVDAREQMARLPGLVSIGLIFVLSFGAALRSAAAWETVLKFLNPTPFDTVDPIFERDLSFYIFRLPLLQGIQDNLLGLLIWCLLIAITVYGLKGEIRPERGWKYFLTGEAKAHLCLLLAGVALLLAAGFWLERYSLLYSDVGVVFGAGYTDVHARLQAYWLMSFVTVSVAILFLLAIWRSGFSLPSFGIILYLGVLVLTDGLYPWFQQNFVVEPNELALESPYIEHNITFSRRAYSLDDVVTQPFPAETNIDRAALSANQSTVDNIRLWDYQPLLSTYRQLQEIRLYYRFLDADIDRYTLNGDYRQVMISAREMSADQLPTEAQTWINQQLKYTHGFGVVMSPVNQVTSDGLPELFIRNVPPVSTVDLELEEPRIYYGEDTSQYIFTGASTDEFDFPQGDTNATYRYQGEGGVAMGSFLRRLAFAFDLSNLRILISNYFTADTRIHYHRLIQDRIRHIAPFLAFDGDPYIAIIDGRLKWIIDAYTTSNRYPYSEPLSRSPQIASIIRNDNLASLARNDINYIQDSVKVFVDAYDGSVEFFALDEQEPILATYQKIFPGLFLPGATMPTNYRQHLRYPHDFFTIQAQMYRAYHMENPEVFYNREDLWRFPERQEEEATVPMQPYYIIMRLPDFNGAEFLQILPFTPANKDNMIAWMAGGSDGENYGRLLLYEFPKQELIYGPSQIEARIDQTPEISEQLTLWSQQGSRVIRGNLTVIPIEESLLYVEPIYLRAEQGELPELARVIVAYGDDIVMRETLEQSLEVIFGEATAEATAPAAEPTPEFVPEIPENLTELIDSALETYQAGQNALQQGDWQRYGETQRQLESILQQLNQQKE